MTRIHPTAIVAPSAEVDPSVEIGPYAVIGPEVVLGPRCVVGHHATVEGLTILGEDNVIHPYAYVGALTQDLKYRGGRTGTRVGRGNRFREFCTVHAATADGDWTIIGDCNYFLAYTHIAHDCRIGDHVIMSNNGTLAGHVTVEDHVVIGGLTAVHQFCRIGRYAMLGGCAKVVQDVVPYMIADGSPATVRTVNKVGLERAGFGEAQTAAIRRAFKTLYREGLNHTQALDRLRQEAADDPPGEEGVSVIIRFIEASQRGLA